MSAKKGGTKKKAAKKPSGPSFNQMIVKSIGQCRAGPKGASRQAIANAIVKNFGKTPGAMFNAHLRKALASCVDKQIIRTSAENSQRFFLGPNCKAVNPKPKKKKTAKKKKPAKKKKATKKKKKTTKKKTGAKKKKTTTKKKKTTTKKKAGAKKKKTTTKKKKPAKKAGAKKTAKRKSTTKKKKSAKKAGKK